MERYNYCIQLANFKVLHVHRWWIELRKLNNLKLYSQGLYTKFIKMAAT